LQKRWNGSEEEKKEWVRKACSFGFNCIRLGWSKGDESGKLARGELEEGGLDQRVRNLKDVELRQDFEKGVGDVGVKGAERRNGGRRAGLAGFVEGTVAESEGQQIGEWEKCGGGKSEVVEGEVLEVWKEQEVVERRPFSLLSQRSKSKGRGRRTTEQIQIFTGKLLVRLMLEADLRQIRQLPQRIEDVGKRRTRASSFEDANALRQLRLLLEICFEFLFRRTTFHSNGWATARKQIQTCE
jgi:hypothetical protein